MVEVKYRGRLGNNLFQYCFGRILAENLGFKLKAEPIPGFPNTRIEVSGYDYSSYPGQILMGELSDVPRRQKINLNAVIQDKSKRHIIIDGYFQRYEYYKPYKDAIRNIWFSMDMPLNERTLQVDASDIVIHVRRGDVVKLGNALPFSYYKEALRIAKYNQLFICTDYPDDPYIELFKRYKPKIIHTPNNELKDLRFIMSFNKIVISASTFSWWASFLSKAKEIYFPIPLNGFWRSDHLEIDLKVDDKDRYIYIKCKQTYKESIIEKIMKFIHSRPENLTLKG